MDTIEKGILSEIYAFLEQGGDANHQDPDQNTWLHRTAKEDGTKTPVHLLVLDGADLDLVNQSGETPLHVAVMHRNLEVVKALIEFGALIEIKDCLGNSALHYAIHGCSTIASDGTCPDHNDCPQRQVNIDILLLLVEHINADINVRNSEGFTPLSWAITNENLDAFTVLMSKGADVNIANHRLETPLHLAISRGCPNIRIVTELLMRGACPVCFNGFNETPLELVLKRATNDKAKAFAEEFLKLIAIKWRNQKPIDATVEEHLLFLEFYKTCVDEAEWMRGQVARNMTLCDFLLHRKREAINVRFGQDYWTCNKIFELACLSRYPTYFETIINCMSEQELEHINVSYLVCLWDETPRGRIFRDALTEKRRRRN